MQAYFDLQFPGLSFGSMSLNTPISRLWRLVHQVSAHQQIPFAVAFPEMRERKSGFGQKMRIFVRTLDNAEILADRMRDALSHRADHIPGVLLMDGVEVLSSASAYSAWEAYFMVRIPSGVSRHRKNIPLDRANALRAQAMDRRLADIRKKGLPSVQMASSSSSGNVFRLTVERRVLTEQDGIYSGEQQPNGYGLSRATQIIALPVIP